MRLKLRKFKWLVIVLGLLLWVWGINRPFVGVYGANLNYFTLAAKNYQRFGYFKLKFLPTYYPGRVDSSTRPDPYLHHPVFYYFLVSIPFKILGFYNWVSGIVPLIFSIFSLFWLYKISALLFGKSSAYWTVFIAVFTPMMSVFSKQTIFEPAVLSIMLGLFYSYLRYIKEPKLHFLTYVGIFSLLAILIDWSGGYYILSFLLLIPLISEKKKHLKVMIVYSVALIIGIVFFLTIVFLHKNGFHDLTIAVASRQYSAELFSLNFPIIRLILTTLIRIGIYFTPFAYLTFLVLLGVFIKIVSGRKPTLSETSLIFLFVFALVNILFLPSGTFGHVYFLLFFTPVVALTLGRWLSSFNWEKRLVFTVIVSSIVIFATAVTYFKGQQVEKHIWKYQAAKAIDDELLPYQTVAVLNFPGDILEQYFFHPTVPVANFEQLIYWLSNNNPGSKAVFSCWDDCSEEEEDFIASLPYKKNRYANAWLIDNNENQTSNFISQKSRDSNANSENQISAVVNIYRKIRNLLGVSQL